MFLDGVLQSSSLGDSVYHEGLIHPGMLVHPNPKRVAIIGGGEGSSLREVLKHETVEEVHMIEIDEMIVETCRKYLPSMSNCTDIVGVADSCFDDPIVKLFYQDALPFFVDKYYETEDDDEEDDDDDDEYDYDDEDDDEEDGDDDDNDEEEEECAKYDVIVMDAL